MSSISPSLTRCHWCESDVLYVKYHDEEWGKPTYDDQKLFEFIVLESAQAGLNWLTVLRKRENYRKAFANFYVQEVASFTEDDEQRLMLDSGIIRNRLKIKASISNARAFIAVQKEFGSFSNYIWGFLPDRKPIVNCRVNHTEIPSHTKLSDEISKDMKKRGFRFFGTTICYAYMQAVGMVNDQLVSCVSY